jgi:hypothetical protein
VLFGSGAVFVDTTMQDGKSNYLAGTTVKIPYWTAPAPWEDLVDGAAATPAVMTAGSADGTTATPEQAAIQRAAKAIQFTNWAKRNPLDPYGEAVKDLVIGSAGYRDKMEAKLIAAAMDTTGWGAFKKDVFNVSTPAYLTHDLVIDGMGTLGSEGFNDPPALLIVHSATLTNMWKQKDSTGRVLLMGGTVAPALVAGGPTGFMMMPLGIPVMVSDRLVPTVVSSTNKYQSLLLRRRALALYIDTNFSYVSEPKALTDSSIDALSVYYAVHRYFRLDGMTKPGVTHLFHN